VKPFHDTRFLQVGIQRCVESATVFRLLLGNHEFDRLVVELVGSRSPLIVDTLKIRFN